MRRVAGRDVVVIELNHVMIMIIIVHKGVVGGPASRSIALSRSTCSSVSFACVRSTLSFRPSWFTISPVSIANSSYRLSISFHRVFIPIPFIRITPSVNIASCIVFIILTRSFHSVTSFVNPRCIPRRRSCFRGKMTAILIRVASACKSTGR